MVDTERGIDIAFLQAGRERSLPTEDLTPLAESIATYFSDRKIYFSFAKAHSDLFEVGQPRERIADALQQLSSSTLFLNSVASQADRVIALQEQAIEQGAEIEHPLDWKTSFGREMVPLLRTVMESTAAQITYGKKHNKLADGERIRDLTRSLDGANSVSILIGVLIGDELNLQSFPPENRAEMTHSAFFGGPPHPAITALSHQKDIAQNVIYADLQPILGALHIQ